MSNKISCFGITFLDFFFASSLEKQTCGVPSRVDEIRKILVEIPFVGVADQRRTVDLNAVVHVLQATFSHTLATLAVCRVSTHADHQPTIGTEVRRQPRSRQLQTRVPFGQTFLISRRQRRLENYAEIILGIIANTEADEF